MKATTSQLLQDWKGWAIVGTLSPKTANNYFYVVWDLFQELKWKDPKNVTPRDVARWAINLQARGPHMPLLGKKALRSFYEYLQDMRYTLIDPSSVMPAKRESPKVPDSFSRAELELVFNASRALDPRVEPSLQLLYHTGARRSELAAVKAADISSTHIILRGKAGPSGRPRERAIPLNPTSAGAITRLLNLPKPVQVLGKGYADNLVGTGPYGIWQWCLRISDTVNFRVHPHKFRATFATDLLRAGVDVRVVQQLMGHATLNTTMRYLATTDELLVAAVAKLGA